MADEAKPKRQITSEQLENLKKGREEGLETRQKTQELKQFELQQAKEEKHKEKSKKKGNEMKQ